MEIKVLGTGSSGNCYVLSVGEDKILLDAGFNLDLISKKVNLNEIKLAFISHEHRDHDALTKKIPNSQKLVSRGVSVIQGKTIQDFVKMPLNQKFNTIKQVYCFNVEHGDTPNGGIIIISEEETILYITDFNNCKWDLSDIAFTHIIVECNYCEEIVSPLLNDGPKYQRQINSHMGLHGTINFIKTLNRTKLETIYLCHISQTVGDEIIMGATVYSEFKIPVGVFKKNGGINYYGRT